MTTTAKSSWSELAVKTAPGGPAAHKVRLRGPRLGPAYAGLVAARAALRRGFNHQPAGGSCDRWLEWCIVSLVT